MNRIEGAAVARAAYAAKKHAAMSQYAALLESDPWLTAGRASRELGVTMRTIVRWRAELELTGKQPPERPPGAAHGTTAEYGRGCRCDDCRIANTARNRNARMRLAQKDPAEIPHGKGGYKNYGCRCDVCRQAQRDDFRRYRARTS